MSGIVGSVGTKSHNVAHTNAGTLGGGVGFSALIGTIAPHSSATLPTGWLNADGAAVSRATYAALFAVCGTVWGVGDGSTTFNLPDCDSAFLRGTGTSAGFTYHNPATALVTKVSESMGQHGHTTVIGGITASWIAEYCVYHVNCYGGAGPIGANSDNTGGVKDTSAFGGDTRPNHIGVNYIIKYM